MGELYYCFLKVGEYIHVGDEILISGKWQLISKSDYLSRKYCDYTVTKNSPCVRRSYPELLENIEASNRAIDAVLQKISRKA